MAARKAYVCLYKSQPGTGAIISSGYRAKYTYGGIDYYGFVTAAHGTSIGASVYRSTSDTSTSSKIGVILDKKYGGKVDVSFVRMTNSNYTNGQAIYYTSSTNASTRPGTVLDGTQTTVALNTLFYKSGSTTYLTYGRVSSNTYCGYWNGVYFSDLMQADCNMSASGDSGAVTYIVNGATIYGKAISILKGKANGLTVFIKAKNIRDEFGATAY